CVDQGAGGPVSSAATERAVAWVDYLEPHAKRVYEPVVAPGRLAAASLAKKIAGGQLSSPFTAREVRLKGWGRRTDGEGLVAGLDQLEALHWLRRETVRPGPGGGRSTVRYHVNPAILRARR